MPTMSQSTSVWKVSWESFPFLKRLESNSDTGLNFFFFFFEQIMIVLVFFTGVCKMYEEHLKRMNPNSPSITYDISQLFDFIDDLADLSCLV